MHSTHIPTTFQSSLIWRKYCDDMYQSVFTRHMLSSNRDLIRRPEADLWYCCGYFFVFVFTVGVADPKHYPLNPEDMCFSVWGLPSHSHMFQLFEDAENLIFFDTVTNSATESITKVPRPGKFDMRLACRAHLLRWALTQGCGTKGQEILAALTHGLTVYVKY